MQPDRACPGRPASLLVARVTALPFSCVDLSSGPDPIPQSLNRSCRARLVFLTSTRFVRHMSVTTLLLGTIASPKDLRRPTTPRHVLTAPTDEPALRLSAPFRSGRTTLQARRPADRTAGAGRGTPLLGRRGAASRGRDRRRAWKAPPLKGGKVACAGKCRYGPCSPGGDQERCDFE